MGIIFYFSSRTALESSGQSSVIVEFLKRIFGDNYVTDLIVRKCAHCLEYTGLALLFNTAMYFTHQKKRPFLSIALSSLYAVTDELHQIFVDGRSCELRDWAIDTGGAIIGTAGFLIIFALICLIGKKSQINN